MLTRRPNVPAAAASDERAATLRANQACGEYAGCGRFWVRRKPICRVRFRIAFHRFAERSVVLLFGHRRGRCQSSGVRVPRLRANLNSRPPRKALRAFAFRDLRRLDQIKRCDLVAPDPGAVNQLRDIAADQAPFHALPSESLASPCRSTCL
jgi:hypothetical protein